MENDQNCTPPELREVAERTLSNLLPTKSREVYEKEFANFETWCRENKVQGISENVLIAYFDMQSKTKKSSTLRSIYSMLRSCLNIYKNVDISHYAKLQAFLKKQAENYQPKKSKILEVEDICRFIGHAENKMYPSNEGR
jgi:site-specific recombinase XerD